MYFLPAAPVAVFPVTAGVRTVDLLAEQESGDAATFDATLTAVLLTTTSIPAAGARAGGVS